MVDHPNHNDYQQLFDELRQLDATSETRYDAKRYNIIHDLAHARFYEAKPYFIAGLQNPDPDYRLACIKALVTHWQDADPQIVSRVLDMALNEPDSSVRYLAIDSLRILKTQDALPVLKKSPKTKRKT